MVMEYATITGTVVIPGTTTGIPGELRATPRTTNGVLTFPAEDVTTIGYARADVTSDGTLDPALQIPIDVPEGLTWRLTFHPKGKGNLPVHLGDYPITANGDLADLVPIVGTILGGLTDHGEISGTIEVTAGAHEFDLTGDLAVTTLGFGDITLHVHGTGTLSVADTDFDIDGDEVILIITSPRGVRTAYLAGGETGTPGEATPPTAGTLAASSVTDTTFTLTVTGAADETALAASPYSFSTDNGSSWSGYQSSAVRAITDKTASTAYQCKHRVKDAAGNVTVGSAITVTTEAAALIITDDFTGTDASNIVGRVPTSGTASAYVAGADMANMGGAASLKIASNKAVSAGGGVNAAKLPFTAGTTVTIAVDYNFNGVTSGDVKVALGDASNHYYAQVGGSGNGFLLKGDVSYNSGAIAGQPASGRLLLEVTTTTVTAKVNGTTIATTTRLGGAWSTPHAAIAIESSNTAITLDNLEVSIL